jgi:hypothetical protein
MDMGYVRGLGGEPTAIKAAKSVDVNAESWLTLDGQRLPNTPTKRGIYIKNGKKVVK